MALTIRELERYLFASTELSLFHLGGAHHRNLFPLELCAYSEFLRMNAQRINVESDLMMIRNHDKIVGNNIKEEKFFHV